MSTNAVADRRRGRARRQAGRALAARRQQRGPAGDEGRRDLDEYRIWQWHTRGHAEGLGNTARYPGMTDRWQAALSAARRDAPLEGERA